MNKGRAPRPVRRMGTEIHEDRRTRRQRTRTDENRAAFIEHMDWDDDCDGNCRAGRYCVQHAE